MWIHFTPSGVKNASRRVSSVAENTCARSSFEERAASEVADGLAERRVPHHTRMSSIGGCASMRCVRTSTSEAAVQRDSCSSTTDDGTEMFRVLHCPLSSLANRTTAFGRFLTVVTDCFMPLTDETLFVTITANWKAFGGAGEGEGSGGEGEGEAISQKMVVAASAMRMVLGRGVSATNHTKNPHDHGIFVWVVVHRNGRDFFRSGQVPCSYQHACRSYL